MTYALSCMYVAILLIFAIVFLVDWIRLRKKIRQYWKYGLWFGIVIVGMDLLIVAITPSSWGPGLFVICIAEPITLIRIIGFTMLGMYYCAVSGYPSLPLLLRKFSPAPVQDLTIPNPPEDQPGVLSIENEVPQPIETVADFYVQPTPIVQAQPESQPAADVLPDIRWKNYFIAVFGASAISILYSVVLFLLTKPHPSQIMQQVFRSASSELSGTVNLQTILFVIEVAIAEELVFRLGIQNFLVKTLKLQNKNYWIAILLTSALWTLGHVGSLDPEWVKFAQIFPIGILLGWLLKKYGAESTILVHTLFNVVLIFLGVYLIK